MSAPFPNFSFTASMACTSLAFLDLSNSTRTTQLYDRRPDDVTLDEIEKIQI